MLVRRSVLWLIVIATGLLEAAPAAPDAFYDAEVKGNNLFAYAGPGSNFYPTSILKSGQIITVAGPVKEGWLPILPPPESFSWIPADNVKENRDGSGLITQDATRIFLGSTLSDARQVHQVVLNKGDVVQIIDEQQLNDRASAGRWFKILPPASERRYIPAESISGGNASSPMPTIPATAAGPIGSTGQGGDGLAATGTVLPIAARVGQRVFPPGEVLLRSSLRWANDSTRPLESPSGVVKTSVPFKDDPTKPLLDRAVLIGQQLSEMRIRAPSQWDLDAAKKAINKLADAAKTDADKKLVLGLADGQDQLQKLYDKYQAIERRRELFLDQDRDLSMMIKRQQQSAGIPSSRFDASGVLRRSSVTIDNQPTYMLEDAAGLPSHYVNFRQGILAESYIGQKIGLFGQESRRDGVALPRLIVEQVAPVE
jgi:hypothetical protein